MFIRLLLSVLLFLLPGIIFAQRAEIILDNNTWSVWLDSSALWKDDQLFLPGEVKLDEMPVNAPSNGWENLYRNNTVTCSLPATAELLFGNANDWIYHGVSWYVTKVNIPSSWEGKKISISAGNYRFRIEIYVNEKLAGYDIIAQTMYEVDITKYIIPGKENNIALRITNPGGGRGWEDFYWIEWGKYKLPHSHDYSGIGGSVVLRAVNPLIQIQDIFVKNLLPAEKRSVKISCSINSEAKKSQPYNCSIEIRDSLGIITLFKKDSVVILKPGNNLVTANITIPSAELWDIDNPVLYNCMVKVERKGNSDQQNQVFGFRTFEIKSIANKHNFYFNGKRIRTRSAIDWGIYAYNGLAATDEMASRSIAAVKAIGHNGLNFHRKIGDTRVMDYADKLGVYLYEEPGAFHTGGQGYNLEESPVAVSYMLEKVRRMVVRDRNHPSLIQYSLCNEDDGWTPSRQSALKLVNELDDSRLALNTSGNGQFMHNIPHYRPYENTVRYDYADHHTVQSEKFFPETDLSSHNSDSDSAILYWGEVRCYTGPEISPLICQKTQGYDLNLYTSANEKLQSIFSNSIRHKTNGFPIKDAADLVRQTGRGLMYIDGRLSQVILSHDAVDGYAINGWSSGPQMPDKWSSAITDIARNLRGPAEDYAYWIRNPQIAIFRKNGKYFSPGDTAHFEVNLINEGIIPAGCYTLSYSITDGEGNEVWHSDKNPFSVIGGDVYAQKISVDLPVIVKNEWISGYITLNSSLENGNEKIAIGSEQILLNNRKSNNKGLAGKKILVTGWDAAKTALIETGVVPVNTLGENPDVILAGALPCNSEINLLLDHVYQGGKKMIIRFDSLWADVLYKHQILSKPVSAWGGLQTGHWNGNGWGYIDYYAGNQSIPGGEVISTRSWEVSSDPKGFFPFESNFQTEVYGLYTARNQNPETDYKDIYPEQQSRKYFTSAQEVLVLIGEITYGKGSLLLQASYPVDENSAFSDMLFFGLLTR